MMKKYYIKDLQKKYGLKTRQSIYDRLKAISAESGKEGNKSYVTEEVVTQLDQLDEHLNRGGSMRTFTPMVTPTVYSETDSVNSETDSVNSEIDSVNSEIDISPKYVQLDFLDQLEDLVVEVVQKINPPNPINHWERLDKAVERGYILSSKEVQALVGTKPKGIEWTRGAFKFIRFGKIGNHAGWKVTRI